MATHTPEEKAALERLDMAILAQNCGRGWIFPLDELRTLKAMLARPTLPEELNGAEIELLWDAWLRARGDKKDHIMALHRALYAHLTKPKTKEVEFWRLEFAQRHFTGAWQAEQEVWPNREFLDGRADEMREDTAKFACIRITGPHKQQVPA